jgi:hypothetical protein
VKEFFERNVGPIFAAFVLVAGLAIVAMVVRYTTSAPPPEMRTAVQVDLAKLELSASKSVEQGDKTIELLTEIKTLLTPKRALKAEETPLPKMPDGSVLDVATFSAGATGRFTVSGMTYRSALAMHGFTIPQDVTESQCQSVYDAWKSGQSPMASQSPCVGGFCPVKVRAK